MTIRISSLFLLFVGALWVWWLSVLSARAVDPQHKSQKCRDVLPWLRTTLHVFTFVLLVLLFCSGIAIMATDRGGVGEKVEGLVMLGVVITLCIFQLNRIYAVRFSDRTVEEDCTRVAHSRHVALTVVAGVFILAGGIGLIDGMSGSDSSVSTASDRDASSSHDKGSGRSRRGSRNSRSTRSKASR